MTQLGDVVRRFGIEPDRIRRMAARANVHWDVRAGNGRFVLRRYASRHGARDSIEWEARVVRHLAANSWPVAVPLGDPVEVDGSMYSLFPHLGGGRQPKREEVWGECGRILAGLHGTLGGLAVEQRPGWKDSFETARTADRRAPLLDLLTRTDRDMALRAARFAEQAEGVLGALQGTPRMAIHGDFAPWNVSFRHGKLTAIYDFEFAHLDARAADVAWARRGYHDEVVRGYLERATLSDDELGALHLFWIAWVLNLV